MIRSRLIARDRKLYRCRLLLRFKKARRGQRFLALHTRISNLHQYIRTIVPAHLRTVEGS
jgi:hypothetical protein